MLRRDMISYSATATVTNIFISCKKSLILSRGKLQEILTRWQFSNFTDLLRLGETIFGRKIYNA